jgi:hypothetical protein
VNDQNLQDWITALRSGDYEQGEGQLCSLGVLLDVIDPTLWEDVVDETGGDRGKGWRLEDDLLLYHNLNPAIGDVTPDDTGFVRNATDCNKGEAVRVALGITDWVHEKAQRRNDDGWSFYEIADWLEDLRTEDYVEYDERLVYDEDGNEI